MRVGFCHSSTEGKLYFVGHCCALRVLEMDFHRVFEFDEQQNQEYYTFKLNISNDSIDCLTIICVYNASMHAYIVASRSLALSNKFGASIQTSIQVESTSEHGYLDHFLVGIFL